MSHGSRQRRNGSPSSTCVPMLGAASLCNMHCICTIHALSGVQGQAAKTFGCFFAHESITLSVSSEPL